MIADALADVRHRIEKAKARVGRVDTVQLIAVTKNHPVQMIEEAAKLGVTTVGENRVQEAKGKMETYVGPALSWHLIGHLQVNKVRQAVPLFDMIHSVDSLRVAHEIERVAEKCGKVQRILLQVNVAREASKSGIPVEEFETLVTQVVALPHVKLEGMMCMAPLVENTEDVRPIFRVAYNLFTHLQYLCPHEDIKYLSMGMTHDYEIAIEEGANMVRVGTGIFGERDYSEQ